MCFFLVNVFFCEFSEFLLGGEERWGLLRKLFVYLAEFCHVAAQSSARSPVQYSDPAQGHRKMPKVFWARKCL